MPGGRRSQLPFVAVRFSGVSPRGLHSGWRSATSSKWASLPLAAQSVGAVTSIVNATLLATGGE